MSDNNNNQSDNLKNTNYSGQRPAAQLQNFRPAPAPPQPQEKVGKIMDGWKLQAIAKFSDVSLPEYSTRGLDLRKGSSQKREKTG